MNFEVGDLVAGADGSWMVRPPERCANGHVLRGQCIVGTSPCSCGDRHLHLELQRVRPHHIWPGTWSRLLTAARRGAGPVLVAHSGALGSWTTVRLIF
jgi:hypothetical protein